MRMNMSYTCSLYDILCVSPWYALLCRSKKRKAFQWDLSSLGLEPSRFCPCQRHPWMATSLGCEATIGAFGFLGSLICVVLVLEVKQEPCSVTKSPRGIIIFIFYF